MPKTKRKNTFYFSEKGNINRYHNIIYIYTWVCREIGALRSAYTFSSFRTPKFNNHTQMR